VQTKKRKMNIGEAFVGMNRSGSQLLKQNILSGVSKTLWSSFQIMLSSGGRWTTDARVRLLWFENRRSKAAKTEAVIC